MKPIGVGILGFAHGHVHAYCARWQAEPALGVHVAAGWDHDPARGREAAAKYSLDFCTTPAELLARPDLGAVVIAAETSRHADLAEQAAAAGKATIVQKPLCLTLAEADRMVAAVRRAGVPFTLAWQMRTDAHNIEAKALLAGGRFGRLCMVRRRHCLNTHMWKDFDKTWHVNPALNRDMFADDASHPIDFIYWLLGMPVSVTAELGTLVNPKVPNDTGIALFRYADGAFAEVSCCFVTPAGENTLEIAAEKGVIIGNYGDGPSNSVRPPGAPQLKWYLAETGKWEESRRPEVKVHGERIGNLAPALAEFLHGRRPPIATAEEGRDVLRLVLACYESSDSGRRVML
ncbi:MAG: putative oxidoreductase YhhX [Lentisphaerae bacterium ADurb.BinA184]|nr:MAG: putative oxidoreductase YhhX [Lentisphaerae bacterium ADurb.BinA184]